MASRDRFDGDGTPVQGAEHDVAPQRLVVEITETVVLDVPTAMARVAALRDMGVSVSIDDFGTGYTSISQMRHLAVDTLKVDRSFVAADGPGDRELLELIVGAAHGCGLRVVAEGVETPVQLAALITMGCDSVQGYHLGRPVPTAALHTLPSPERLLLAANYEAVPVGMMASIRTTRP
ncbi:EAL domain-containing protein [Solicola sp. PLA-1-18]|uniref:EAL domain-containing protein n=1 Tax=Solicola sp. PLA-1-18 TaxID=3380532 RepID=UPI003B7C1490